MQITFTLSQGNVYSHTIALNVNESTTLKVGQVLGNVVFKFFRSTMAIRKCGNKGFSFNNPFDFTLHIDGNTLCDTAKRRTDDSEETIQCEETIVSKCRMSNKADGQRRFTKLLASMLFSSLDDTYKSVHFEDVLNTIYTTDNLDAEVREFLDSPIDNFVG